MFSLVGSRLEVATNLFTLGPARIGRDWETIAAPEIRAQSAALVARLLGRHAAASGCSATVIPDNDKQAVLVS